MKKVLLLAFAIHLSVTANAQLKVYRNGDVTIGTASQSSLSKLTIGGTVTTNGIIVPFDENTKKYAASLDKEKAPSTVSSVMAMDVVSYNIPSINEEGKETTESSSIHYALSPDVVEFLFPTLVTQGKDGVKGINYIELIPLLVRSIQELQLEVETLKGTLAAFEDQNWESRSKQSTSFNSRFSATLMQNNPNPVKEQARIGYRLTGDYSEAVIRICDVNGNVAKTFDVQSGTGSVTVNASELNMGLYLYSLIVDGNIIDTKKMIVTK